MKKIRRSFRVLLACFGVCMAQEHLTVTVLAGARQTFMGMGTLQGPGEVLRGEYDQLPTHVRDSMNKVIWHDCKFRYMRLNCITPLKDFQYGLNPLIKDARKWNPNLETLWDPGVNDITNFDAITKDLVERLLIGKQMGWNPTTTGIANEPDMHDRMLAWQAPLLIKSIRNALDAAGLSDIKLIAPETTSADEKAQDFIRAIIADSQALADLDGFSTHSYNSSITEEMEELVGRYILNGEKTFWQTESSDFIYEEFNDGYAASSALSRFLSDMNRLCNVWIFYRGIQPVNIDNHNWNFNITGRFNGFYMILYRYDVMDYRKFLKCWYFQAMNSAVDIGAVFRKSKANFTEINPAKYWWKDDWMEFAFGRKTPVYLAAAVNPDGSWGIGICNYTGVKTPPDQPELTSIDPATDYRVTLRIEELAGKGDVKFSVYRANRTYPHIHKEDSLTMHDGELIIDSVGSFELLCLRSMPAVMPIRKTNIIAAPHVASGLWVQNRSDGAVIFKYSFPKNRVHAQSDARLWVSDPAGRIAGEIPFSCPAAGNGTLIWDAGDNRGGRTAAGYYLVNMQAAGYRLNAGLILPGRCY